MFLGKLRYLSGFFCCLSSGMILGFSLGFVEGCWRGLNFLVGVFRL